MSTKAPTSLMQCSNGPCSLRPLAQHSMATLIFASAVSCSADYLAKMKRVGQAEGRSQLAVHFRVRKVS